jgi:isoprenylcysteine carboxyl methyltransferase (ICMT) family protein YpbQ
MGAITDGVSARAKIVHPVVTGAGLRNAASNCILGLSFFIAIIPAARALSWSLLGLANIVWLTGAAIMGVLSFVRTPPRSTMVNMSTIAATTGMLFLPCFMRPIGASSGGLALSGVAFELFGIALTQVARVYMGRSFGVLPANRGVVSKGPFSSIRHPIYFGWLVLSIGYAMSYPTARNIILIASTLPFMVWRIEQEESHLSEDPEYRTYERRVRFRLWPGVI